MWISGSSPSSRCRGMPRLRGSCCSRALQANATSLIKRHASCAFRGPRHHVAVFCNKDDASHGEQGSGSSDDSPQGGDGSNDDVADAFRRERERRGYGSSSTSSSSTGSNMYTRNPYESLLQSKVMRNEVVMKEYDEIMTTLATLSRMASKFPDFDLEGKKMYLQQMEAVLERHEVFMKRLELSEDEFSKEYLRYTNGQMLNAGFTMQTLLIGAKQSLQDYRNWVSQEERAIADPVMHQQFLQAFKLQWSQSALGKFNMDMLGNMKNVSPEALMKATADPEFYKAVKEICDQPSLEVLQRWAKHPNIGPWVQDMMRAMQ